MAFKSEELILALFTESDGVLMGARSCGGTQPGCDALEFNTIAKEDPENLKILQEIMEGTLAKIKEARKKFESRRPSPEPDAPG